MPTRHGSIATNPYCGRSTIIPRWRQRRYAICLSKTIADDDCLLFMWAVSPNLDQAIIVGQSWSFKYITVGFVWDKQKSLPGFYTLPSCELCLIFKKGKIPQPRGDRTIKQLLSAKSGLHSTKPWIVRDNIAKMFPNQSKIELFARPDWVDYQTAPGWDFWGNEVE